MEKKRADQLLVEKKLAPSRTHAQDMIKEGLVFVKSAEIYKLVSKPGQLLSGQSEFLLEKGNTGKYVSRAGLKLEAALNHTGLKVASLMVLDVGISTGGFTDCLLKFGVQKVVGIDVGKDQVHPIILQNPQVQVFEGINARHLSSAAGVIGVFPPLGFDLIVMDVSFISSTLILPEVLPYLKRGGHFLGLIKPQFECRPQDLGKNGVISNEALYPAVEKKIRTFFQATGFEILDYFLSKVEGKDGNKEYFILASR